MAPKKKGKMQKWHIIAIVLVLYLGGAYMYGWAPFGSNTPDLPGPGPSPGPGPGDDTPVLHGAAKLQFTIRDVYDTAVTTTNTKVDIMVSSSPISFMGKREQSSVDSGPEQSAEVYSDNEIVVLHVSSDVNPTGGTDHYDCWYTAKLTDGSPVYKLSIDALTATKTSPTYEYEIDFTKCTPTGQTVMWTPGNTPYWGLGSLKVIPRTTAANLDVYALYGGTTLSSITDGSTKDTTTTGAVDVSLATTDEKFWIKFDAGATNIGYAAPMYTVSNTGKLEVRKTYAIVSTNMTAVNANKLIAKGWKKLQDSTLTTEVAYYHEIPTQIPLKGNKFVYDLEYPCDTSAAGASSHFYFKLWFIDFQLESNLAGGSVTTSVPTAYGCIGEYGIDAMIFASAYSTSSGAGSGQVLTWRIGTPA